MAESPFKKAYIIKECSLPSVSISAGAIGTYATYIRKNVSVDGYKPILITFSQIGHGASYLPIANLSNNEVEVIFYRTLQTAYTVPANDVKVNVLYEAS